MPNFPATEVGEIAGGFNRTVTGCSSAAPTSRSPRRPVGGWYGMKKGLRGRFGMYAPPLMEALGLAELEHNPKNNRMRAI
jgi:hypothetical protein